MSLWLSVSTLRPMGDSGSSETSLPTIGLLTLLARVGSAPALVAMPTTSVSTRSVRAAWTAGFLNTSSPSEMKWLSFMRTRCSQAASAAGKLARAATNSSIAARSEPHCLTE